MATKSKSKASRGMPGENIKTTHWEDARHWLSIYADLLEFKRGILDRVGKDIARLPAPARVAAAMDLEIISDQMKGYEVRLDVWNRRLWELHGLMLDRTSRVVRHRGREVNLTNREFQLLKFLLDHPHRYFTTGQILSMAWSDSALFPEEVRNYVQRIRRILAELEVPAELVNKPRRGYSLVFRDSV